jgi:hypothetical protein
MTETYPVASLAERMREPITAYADLLRQTCGENAQSLTLYGTIAAGTFDADRHTACSVLIVERVDLSELQAIARHGSKFGGDRIAAPLIMTPAYVTESCDTFPLELVEIQQNHHVLFGDDYFAKLTFTDADVRRQCERELKVLAMGLRQGLLAAMGHAKLLGEIEASTAESLLRVLRGMLWLKGERESQPGSAVVESIARLLNREFPGIASAVARDGQHDQAQFERLYADVEALGEIVDAW